MAKIQQNGLMAKLTYAASVLGLMVVGGMTAENVSISFPLKFGSGNEATTLNDVFNNIISIFFSSIYFKFINNLRYQRMLRPIRSQHRLTTM